ncbi:hypothetical protein Tco_1491342 [Tanacetum coccineum]
MDDPNITMEEYIQLMADKARGRDQTFNWETATYGEVYCDDPDLFTYFKTDFPAIVYNDASTSNQNVSYEPTIRPSERNDNVSGVFINLEISKCWSLEISRRLFNTLLLTNLQIGEPFGANYQGDGHVQGGVEQKNDEESSDDECNNGDHRPLFDHHQNDNNKGDENNQMERRDHSNRPENFVQNDAPQSSNDKPNEGMCRMDKFKVIKYSVGDNEEFLEVRALEHNSWAQNVNGVSSIYLDIFRKKDEGWTVTRAK